MLGGGCLVKVNVAQVAKGQMAGQVDLASLLTGGDNASFASLLDLGGNKSGLAHRADGDRGKQGSRSKEKDSSEGQSSLSGNASPGATTGPVGLQTLPNVGIAPWSIEFGDLPVSGDARDEARSLSGVKATIDGPAVRMRPPAAKEQTVEAPTLNQQQGMDENVAEMTPFHDLKDPGLIEPLKDSIAGNQATATTHAATPIDKGTVSAIVQPPSVACGDVQPSIGLIDNGAAALSPQDEADPPLVGISAVQKSAVPNHEVKSDNGSQNPTASLGERWSDLHVGSGGGQGRSSEPSQGVVDAASSSTAGGRSQGDARDTHHSPFDAKEVVAVSHATTPQTSQDTPLGALGTGGPVPGQSALVNSTHRESAPELMSDAQLKGLSSPKVPAVSVARLLGSAMHGDLRVGVQTEAFGRVTIQTNAQDGQLSAQLSLENAKESATLAAHLPGVEQKIVQQHGLDASVRLVGSFDGGAGAGSMGRDQSGSARRDPQQYRSDVWVQPAGIEHESPHDGRGLETALLGSRYLVSSRLDVTV